MTVTQWSVTWFVSTITPGDTRGAPSRIKDISLEQFALLPLALEPSVSRNENIHPTIPCFQTSYCSLTFGNVRASFFAPPLLNNGNLVNLLDLCVATIKCPGSYQTRHVCGQIHPIHVFRFIVHSSTN